MSIPHDRPGKAQADAAGAAQLPLRIAIAGLGVASTQILPAIERAPEVELVAAAAPRREPLEAFQRRYGGRVYQSVEALCQDPDVEAVWVATPNQFHCEHVLTATEGGKHVIVEKPMGLTIEECARMVDAASRNGVKLLCGHTQSFHPAIRAMREIIVSGQLGALRAVHTWMYTDWMLRPRMPQEVDVSRGGGVVYRQGPHQIDIVRLLGGGLVRSVRAMTGQWMAERPCPGSYAAYLEFADGTPATLAFSGYGYFDTSELTWGLGQRQYSPDQRTSIRQALRSGTLDEARAKESMRFGQESPSPQGARPPRQPGQGDFFGLTIATCERGDIRQSPAGLLVYDDDGIREIQVSGSGASRGSELGELYEAVRHNRSVLHDGHWGMATLEVCLAIMESARTRREIVLSHQKQVLT